MIEADARQVGGFINHLREIFEREVPRDLEGATQATANAIVDEMQEYPPETEANQPPPPYYERGVGIHLVNKILRTSQQMDTRWSVDVRRSEGLIEAHIRNSATYSSYAHGLPGEEQASFHTMREWPPLLGVALAHAGESEAITEVQYRGRTIARTEFDEVAEKIAKRISAFQGA